MEIISIAHLVDSTEWSSTKKTTELRNLCCWKNKCHYVNNDPGRSVTTVEVVQFNPVPTHQYCIHCFKTEDKSLIPFNCTCKFKVLHENDWYSNQYNWEFENGLKRLSTLCCSDNHADGSELVRGSFKLDFCTPHALCVSCYAKQISTKCFEKKCSCPFAISSYGVNNSLIRVRL